MSTNPHELPIDIPDRWKAQTRYKHQTKKARELGEPLEEICHELLYGTAVHETEKGERGLRRLRNLADLFNKQRVVPRDRPVQCLADDSGSIETRLAKQNRRAARHTVETAGR